MWHHGIDIYDTEGVVVELGKANPHPGVHIASGYVLHRPDGSTVNVITEVHDRERFDRLQRESGPIHVH